MNALTATQLLRGREGARKLVLHWQQEKGFQLFEICQFMCAMDLPVQVLLEQGIFLMPAHPLKPDGTPSTHPVPLALLQDVTKGSKESRPAPTVQAACIREAVLAMPLNMAISAVHYHRSEPGPHQQWYEMLWNTEIRPKVEFHPMVYDVARCGNLALAQVCWHNYCALKQKYDYDELGEKWHWYLHTGHQIPDRGDLKLFGEALALIGAQFLVIPASDMLRAQIVSVAIDSNTHVIFSSRDAVILTLLAAVLPAQFPAFTRVFELDAETCSTLAPSGSILPEQMSSDHIVLLK